MSSDYEQRVRALEDEGLTRSDAQGVVDAEDHMREVGLKGRSDPMDRQLTQGEKEVIEMLWGCLPVDEEHSDRRQTAFGSKTKIGLVRTLKNMLSGEAVGEYLNADR